MLRTTLQNKQSQNSKNFYNSNANKFIKKKYQLNILNLANSYY